MQDIDSLPEELFQYIKLVGGPSLSEAMDRLRPEHGSLASFWYSIFPPQPKKKSFRRLSYFADREGKTRVIAILDYWSQTVLRPLHDRMNAFLRAIPNDCTFDQDRFTSILPSTGPYHSLDLSNATDRMPIELQKSILSRIIGKPQAEVWARILTRWEYQSDAGPVFYRTGQPMGAYSS